MLCAHYDSVPEGPGASDNAAGVAVVLETLRALKAGPPLDRDVIALFPDGEECGFHGSLLFVDEHPWAKEVGVVLNFDARGNSGPSIMFETSDANGWLIRQFAQVAPQPLATSLSMDVYKVLPNDTDLTIFKNAGMGGLNFAFGAGLAYYHTAEDSPENLDQRTLQHQGENAVAIARHLAGLDLELTREDDVIYTSILSRTVLSYSKSWIVPLAALALGLFLALVVDSRQRGEMTIADLASGTLMLFVAMAASLLAIGVLFLAGFCSSVVRDASHSSIPWFKYDVPIMTGCALLQRIRDHRYRTVMGAATALAGAGARRFRLVARLGAFDRLLVERCQLSFRLAHPGRFAGHLLHRQVRAQAVPMRRRGIPRLITRSAPALTANSHDLRRPQPGNDGPDHDSGRALHRSTSSSLGSALPATA